MGRTAIQMNTGKSLRVDIYAAIVGRGIPVMIKRLLLSFVCCVFAARGADLPADHAERMTKGLELFQKQVKGILVENCVTCHGGDKVKGELNMVTREGLLKGGADGVVVVPFKGKESRLLRLVRHEEDPNMPDKKPKLADEKIKALEEWIENGAPYEGALLDGVKVAKEKGAVSDEDRKWWAFQPLKKVNVPEPPKGGTTYNEVDRFIAAKAAEKGLAISPKAERRVLIRRLYLDLLGLPPTPEEVAAFVEDKAPDAWDQLIDRTLASPHYGERWARHWLDVARFAESSGFEHDYDREGAYQYRDFVIRALNEDMPFDQFLRWQIAGDEFQPDNAMALAATGFLGSGVFPTQITANEVERTRYDAMDDMLSTTSLAFIGMTVGCARCHDHKFDPIPTADYYRLLSTFTTTTRSVVDLDVEPEITTAKKAKWAKEQAPLELDLAEYEIGLQPKFEGWLRGGAKVDGAVWTLLDLTRRESKAGATFKKMEDGSWLAEGKNGDHDEYTFKATLPDSPEGGTTYGVTGLKLEALSDPSLPKGGPGRADNGNIGLSRIRVFVGTNEVKIAKAVATFEQNANELSIASALDDKPNTGWAVDPQFGKNHAAVFTFAEPIREAGELTVKLEFSLNTRHNIGRARLSVFTGAEPTLDGEVLSPKIAEILAGDVSKISAEDRKELFAWWKRRDAGWNARESKLQAHAKLRPTGLEKTLICGEGYTPLRMHTQGADFFNETYLLRRGNTDAKQGVANQDFLQVMMRAPERGQHWKYEPPKGAKFSGRRRSLANWMTDLDEGAGAQVARVIVNRLWQHHFGQGIVATPNDFGHAGALPTHPELLDWLAGELVRNGWRLKPIHKLILTSATYQQNTMADGAKQAADPENKLFVRRLPRRLEGEALRDSVLAVTGALDPKMYGPGTKDETSVRRSIYFTVKRSQLVGSMVVFDMPEPLVSQAVRPTTTVAPQALFLMNAPEVREWSKDFAKRLENEPTPEAEVKRAFLLAVGREPNETELKDSTEFLKKAELTDFCQVVLGLNEFAYEN
jgi:mono/diheme cytochrome c family protein